VPTISGGLKPVRHPKFESKARSALALAKENLETAKEAASKGRMNSAATSLVTAGEEVVKARIYWMVYEDIATFNPTRKGERIYFEEKDLGQHLPKQTLLFILGFGQAAAVLLSQPELMTDETSRALDLDPEGVLDRQLPGFAKLSKLYDRLEDIRQSTLSGPPKSGRGRLQLSSVEFEGLATAVGEIIDFADYEQNHFQRTDADLLRVQAQIALMVPSMEQLASKLQK
jgi:hypothetical protein